MSPLPLMPKIAAVADNDRGPFGNGKGYLVGVPHFWHEFDAALVQGSSGFSQTLQHKGKMTAVGLRVIRHQTETNDDPLPQSVCLAHSEFQGRVGMGPLRLLHPIQDV